MKWHFGIALLGLALIPLAAAPPLPAHKSAAQSSGRIPTKTSTRKSRSAPHTAVAARSNSKAGASTAPVRGYSRAAAYRASRGRLARASRYSHIAPSPSYQLRPDPDRYRQIQQALTDRGYFKGEANGAWGADSVDAMRRFQYDQKLDDDGKITSLSLIGLGLGPRHGDLAAAPPAIPPASSTPPGGTAPAPAPDPATTAQAPASLSQPRPQ